MALTTTPIASVELGRATADWTFSVDGWAYPVDPAQALVRLREVNGHYEIQRRRDLGTPWTLLVKALVVDFDRVAFDTWRSTWKLSV
jgi:hypothetical protein